MSSSDGTVLEIALAYDEVWTRKDVDGALSYLAQDVVCEAPSGVINGVSAYRAYIEGFNQVFLGADRLNAYSDGDTAVIVQEIHSRGVPSAKAMSRFTVEDGKIVHVLMIFDRMTYAEARQAAATAG
jgi:ketosteroid isomerase-like protein